MTLKEQGECMRTFELTDEDLRRIIASVSRQAVKNHKAGIFVESKDIDDFLKGCFDGAVDVYKDLGKVKEK